MKRNETMSRFWRSVDRFGCLKYPNTSKLDGQQLLVKPILSGRDCCGVGATAVMHALGWAYEAKKVDVAFLSPFGARWTDLDVSSV